MKKPKSPPNTAFADPSEGTATIVVPAMSRASPREAPDSPNIMARVTMNDGSPVRSVTIALISPTQTARATASSTPTHTDSS